MMLQCSTAWTSLFNMLVVITDPDDARFDLEAFLNHVAKTTSA